jgi:N-acetylmuramoyl-L-alanine amidase
VHRHIECHSHVFRLGFVVRVATVVVGPVCIDAGHHRPGSGCIANGIDEATYNLSMAFLARSELQRRGIDSVLTREDARYVSFTERAAIARRAHSRGTVVIHVNADLPQCHGPMSFHRGLDGRAMDAADMFVETLSRPGEYVDKGIVLPMRHQCWVAGVGGWREAAWNCMFRHDEPVILVEVGYATNPDEAAWLQSPAGLAVVSTAIADAAIAMIG